MCFLGKILKTSEKAYKINQAKDRSDQIEQFESNQGQVIRDRTMMGDNELRMS